MAISRRFFLKSGTLTALAAGVSLSANRLALAQTGTSPGHQIPLAAQREPSFMFTRATFEPYVNSIFQAPNANGDMVNLRLQRVTTNKPTAKITTVTPRETDSFSLMFRADGQLPPFTSIHKISHPALGTFDLSMTPREKDGVFYYEAVFNHL